MSPKSSLFRARFSDTAGRPVRTRGFKFLRVIYIGVDKLVNSEFKKSRTPTWMPFTWRYFSYCFWQRLASCSASITWEKTGEHGIRARRVGCARPVLLFGLRPDLGGAILAWTPAPDSPFLRC